MRYFYQIQQKNHSRLLACAIVISILLGTTAVADDGHSKVNLSNTPSAFALFEEQAEQGDMNAQYNLGVMFETGWSVEVDNKSAVRWFRAAAEQGDANAQLRLGMLYYLGLGARQSSIKGEKWIRKAAKQSQSLAQKINSALFLGDLPDGLSASSVMLRVRSSYLKNERSAIPVLESLLLDGRQKIRRVEKQKEETTLRERRTVRNTEGQKNPGSSVSSGVERIDSEVPSFIGDASIKENRTLMRGSIATIRLQAKKGLASAQYNLGRMYELGIKLPENKKQAMEWFEKAARQGYVDAEYRMGITLLYGVGAQRDERAGKKWLALAAEHGHAVARNMVAGLRGDAGVSKHGMSLAVHWYHERALVDDGQAAFHLGKVYEHGWGVDQDLIEAIKWYQRASLSGNKEANALADKLIPRLGEVGSVAEKSWLALRLEQYGLPVWLAHPVVITSVIVVIFWPLFPWSKKARRKKARKAALKKAKEKKED